MKALSNRSYFFDKGIRFECLQCGRCCTGRPGTVYVSRSEITAIAQYLRTSESDLIRRFLYPFKDSYSVKEEADGRCMFYRDGCQIYAVRPNQCKTYPFWFSAMRSKAAWDYATGSCPGIGRGHLFSREEILDILQTTF